MLHLTGVKAVNPKYEVLGELSVSLDDIKRFRQLDSKCPATEYRWTSGIETTTGPLGQGVAPVSGWPSPPAGLPATSIARARLFDYDVYALAGDGCMMEGISGEAASLAGTKLANLCWIYDNNHITIEGNTALAYSDDVATRFIGYGWNVTRVGDANNLEMLERAFTIQKHHGSTDPDHGRQPYRLRRAQQAGHQRGAWRTVGRGRSAWPNVITAGRKTPSSSCPTGCASISRPASAGVGKSSMRPGGPSLKSTAGTILNSRSMAPACCAASCQTAGTKAYRRSRRRQGDSQPRTPRGQVLNILAKNVPWLLRLSGSHALMQDAPDVRRGRRFQRRECGRAEPPLRHRGTRHGRYSH